VQYIHTDTVFIVIIHTRYRPTVCWGLPGYNSDPSNTSQWRFHQCAKTPVLVWWRFHTHWTGYAAALSSSSCDG